MVLRSATSAEICIQMIDSQCAPAEKSLDYRLGSYVWRGCRTTTARAVTREGGKPESWMKIES
jgi:hypothetical protein